jgi:hypothetical protein
MGASSVRLSVQTHRRCASVDVRALVAPCSHWRSRHRRIGSEGTPIPRSFGWRQRVDDRVLADEREGPAAAPAA